MEIKKINSKIVESIKKYRYAILVLVIGILLMSVPQKNENKESETKAVSVQTPEISVEEQLADILGQINGVGRVKVMLTEATGAENIYQTNDEYDADDTGHSEHKDTVILTDSDRNESALIKKTIPPKYLGAIIVCQGADKPSVRLALVEAVSKITGLGSDSISVLKMK